MSEPDGASIFADAIPDGWSAIRNTISWQRRKKEKNWVKSENSCRFARNAIRK
jgi:hypothetical protein